MRATSGRGLQPAMDHLFANEGKPVPEAGAQTSTDSGSAMNVDDDDDDDIMRGLVKKGETSAADMEAKVSCWSSEFRYILIIILRCLQSIKCSECGKIFKNTALANYHATKSGHDQFEESTEEACDHPFPDKIHADERVGLDQTAYRRRKGSQT